MLLSQPCLFDYWRNFQAFAPEINVTQNRLSVIEYDISDILVQGSRDYDSKNSPSPGVLEKIPAQRGWLLDVIFLSDPMFGTIKFDPERQVIIYTPLVEGQKIDCCNYALTNGTQQSNVAKINLQLSYEYIGKVTLYSGSMSYGLNLYLKSAGYIVNNGIDLPVYSYINWYYNQKVVELDDSGVKRIYSRRIPIYECQFDMDKYNAGDASVPSLLNPLDTDLNYITIMPYSDMSLGPAFDGDSNRPYKPRGTFGDIEAELTAFYNTKQTVNSKGEPVTQVDLNKKQVVSSFISSTYGTDWGRSGNLNPVNKG